MKNTVNNITYYTIIIFMIAESISHPIAFSFKLWNRDMIVPLDLIVYLNLFARIELNNCNISTTVRQNWHVLIPIIQPAPLKSFLFTSNPLWISAMRPNIYVSFTQFYSDKWSSTCWNAAIISTIWQHNRFKLFETTYAITQ